MLKRNVEKLGDEVAMLDRLKTVIDSKNWTGILSLVDENPRAFFTCFSVRQLGSRRARWVLDYATAICTTKADPGVEALIHRACEIAIDEAYYLKKGDTDDAKI